MAYRPSSRRSSNSRSRNWLLAELEPRLMLAGDAGAAIVQAASLPTAAVTSNVAAATDLVIIDNGIDNAAALMSAVPSNAEIVLIDSSQSGIKQITQAIGSHQNLRSVHLLCHATDGALIVGNESISNENLGEHRDSIAQWQQSMTADGDLLIYGCDLASGTEGIRFLNQLASIAGVDVAASNDRTGASNEHHHADWDLEYRIGQIESIGILATSDLQSFQEQLSIEIYAAGSTGDELMELEINGQIVDTWFVQGTDAEEGRFYPYVVNTNNVNVDDIRINFVNDLYDPATGIDRNLRVDRVVVDGVTYQTEDPSVFATGTFVDGQGITSGNLESEYLNADGYFQFSSSGGGGNGSNIEISLRGHTGSESAQLLIDGSVVATYDNISTSGESFFFEGDGNVTADRVRVAFINDSFTQGQDRNLDVDFLRIDGQTFETEASTTFSTGTWLPADGVQSGFRQSETLHSNGYFQFLAGDDNPGGDDAGSFSLVTSEITVIEGEGSVTLEVQRIGGSSGSASIDYFTAGDTAVAGQDFEATSGRLFFADGEFSKQITINLINDGVAESTESFAVRIDNSSGSDILAPRTSSITLLDDDSGLPRFASFNSAAGLTLNGSASVENGQLELTNTGVQQAGTAFFNSPVSVNSQTSFQSSFTFQIGGGSGLGGADGMTFLLQNSPAGLNGLGRAGGYLGYDGIGQSLAIEFDTSKNGWDQSADSIAVVINGNPANAFTEVESPFNLNNDTLYHAWIDYNGENQHLGRFCIGRRREADLCYLENSS